jgi:hypothetical protein
MSDRVLIDEEEASNRLDVKPYQIARLASAGEVQSFQVGNARYYDADQIDSLAKRRRGEAGDAAWEVKELLLDTFVAVDKQAIDSVRDYVGALSLGEQIVMSMLVNCTRLARGIYWLLGHDLAEESRILSRTLLADAATLAYLHKYRARLEEMALRYLYGSLREEIGLQSEIESLKRDTPGPTAPLPDFRQEIQALQQYARSNGLPRLTNLPPTKDMLRDLNQSQLYVLYKRNSFAVHTQRASLQTRIRSEGPDQLGPRMADDIRQIVAVGADTVESHLTGLIAVTLILDWDTANEIASFRANFIRRVLPELKKRAAAAYTNPRNVPQGNSGEGNSAPPG